MPRMAHRAHLGVNSLVARKRSAMSAREEMKRVGDKLEVAVRAAM